MPPLESRSKESAELMTNATFFYSGNSLEGMSGGPLLDSEGKVLGIHRGTRESQEKIEISVGIKQKFMRSFPYSIKENNN